MSRCTLCGAVVARLSWRGRRCWTCQRERPDAGASVDPSLPFELDDTARRFVEEHPAGAPRDVVAEALGVSRQRVDQIERAALARFAQAARLAGIHPEDLADAIAGRGASQDLYAPEDA